MLLEHLSRPAFILGRRFVVFGRTFVQQGIDFRAPIFGVQQLRPTHFARDDLVALRIIKIRLQQSHVLFRLAVLLLKETLPLVLIPDAFGLTLVLSHAELNASFAVRAKFFAIGFAFFAPKSSKHGWLRQRGPWLGSSSVKHAAPLGVLVLMIAFLLSSCASSGDEATTSGSASQSTTTVPGEKIPDEGRYAPGPPGSSGSVRW